VIVVNRFRVPEPEGADFRARLQTAVGVLGACRGFLGATSGRNLDEPDLWVLVTTWQDVGSYRRALSSYDVKVGVVPLLSEAVDEPSAYETFGEPEAELNVNAPRSLG
jgi:hypothetical protein